jgi:hypothetical protein
MLGLGAVQWEWIVESDSAEPSSGQFEFIEPKSSARARRYEVKSGSRAVLFFEVDATRSRS